MGERFDIKLGFACNNHCIHCVVNPMVENLIKNNKKINLNYAEIITIINSKTFEDASSVVLTGGEPTIRKDFMRIIRLIVSKYPNKKIFIQTNGRLLYKFIDEIKTLTNNVQYIIAIHSTDSVIHNSVVNNRICDSDSYNETMNSLIKLKDVYSNFEDIGRIEIVLSKLNYKSLYKTIVDLHKIGINSIGISYPHLDGHYIYCGIEKVREISMSYAELKPILTDVYYYAVSNPNLKLNFEEVPKCMWRDKNNNLLLLPPNLNTGSDNPGSPTVIYPERIMKDETNDVWRKMHSKPDICKSCSINKHCCGIWAEAFESFKDSGFIPIS